MGDSAITRMSMRRVHFWGGSLIRVMHSAGYCKSVPPFDERRKTNDGEHSSSVVRPSSKISDRNCGGQHLDQALLLGTCDRLGAVTGAKFARDMLEVRLYGVKSDRKLAGNL